MTRPGEVVELSSRRVEPVAPLSPVLEELVERTERFLGSRLRVMFDHVDDALFELAERSGSDHDQQAYFDAMRDIRLQRTGIEGRTIRTPRTRIAQRGGATRAAPAPEAASLEEALESMTLVRNDDLEVSVAVSGIVSKVTSRFSLEIMQLTRRVDALVEDIEISERNNPVGPTALTGGFAEAISLLSVDIRTRIILLKLFERHVMEQLGIFYHEANSRLAEAGVLPNLRNLLRNPNRPAPAVPPRPSAAGPLAMPPAQAGAGDGYGAERSPEPGHGFHGLAGPGSPAAGTVPRGWLQNIAGDLATWRTRTSRSTSTDAGQAVAPVDALLAALDHALGGGTEAIDPTAPAVSIDLRALLHGNVSHGQRIGGPSADVVDVVQMLFDFVLGDRSLAIPMKALIARLQIPILRVALADNGFLDDGGHPARCLLNELSNAGIGWSAAAELRRDALYLTIESIIQRVLKGEVRERAHWQALLDELRAFVREERRRTELVESRVREAERGQARSRQARNEVRQRINRAIGTKALPEPFRQFIVSHLASLMTFAWLRMGVDSRDWLNSIDLLERTVQLGSEPQSFDAEQARDLFRALGNALRAIHPEADDVRQILQPVISGLRGQNLQRPATPPPAPASEPAGIAQPDPPAAVTRAPEEESWAVPERPVAVGAAGFERPAVVPDVEGFAVGCWVELVNRQNIRARVADILQPGRERVLLNRRGMKVATLSPPEIRALLDSDDIRVLDDRQLFERALENVIGTLRNTARARPA